MSFKKIAIFVYVAATALAVTADALAQLAG
jgi:hypothetical protein